MAAGSTSDAPTSATSAPVQQQPERTAPLDSLKQEIGTEFLKLHEALRGMTKTQDDMARQLADTNQLTEQLSLANSSTDAATPASPTATFANITARTSADTVKPFGRTPPLFQPPVASTSNKKTLNDCQFAERIGKDATACILEYGLDAMLSNSDNISEEDRESPAFPHLVNKMSGGKHSTLPAVDLCTPTCMLVH